jgi:hypothetical protein
MSNIDKLSHEEIIKIAQIMGYDDSAEPSERDEFIDTVSRMDLWDLSRLLFFETLEGSASH